MSILAEILDRKKLEVLAAKRERPLGELEAEARAQAPVRGFADALRRRSSEPVRVIAEYKRASPSAGTIRDDLEVEEVAMAYASNGASALSILTDEHFFRGHLSFLGRARQVVRVPLLRKDFVIDPYQVVEARAAGADAILLIVAALEDSALEELSAAARGQGLDALVEIHSEAEAERAVRAGAKVIGVNHRNLNTFEIDMGLTSRLRATVPDDTILVGESGIRGAEDVARLGRDGVHAVLVGEHLMRSPDPGAALTELLTGAVP